MRPLKHGNVATSLVNVLPVHVITLASKIGKLLLLLWTIGMEIDVPPRAEGSRNRPSVITSGYAI